MSATLTTTWSAGVAGIWEFQVSGDDQIHYSSDDAHARQRTLGYDTRTMPDKRTNTQHSTIRVRPLGEHEWGWHSGYYHRGAKR